MNEQIVINGETLPLSILLKSMQINMECILADSRIELIRASKDIIDKVVAEERTVYGINTGFGLLANQRITKDQLQKLQRNIVLSHACGTGELLDDNVVSLILLLKINSLAKGYSGVSLQLMQALMALYNHQVYPCIPAKGSVGASGDLVPLAHMALCLLGEGEVRYQGKLIPASKGLEVAGLKPLILHPKEGLALLNGMQVSCAVALHAYFQAACLFETAIIAGSLSVDAAQASDLPFDERVHVARGQVAQMDVASIFRGLLAGSAIRESHRNCNRIQDPYSLRCQPQIMGAVLHQMRFVADTLLVEANAVTDNPLIFIQEGDIISGGNFHGEIIAMAADNLALAIAEIGSSSERRIALLIDQHFSGLPAFLVKNSGINSGFMIAHVTAASCASDNKALSHPHSVDSIPTSANQEDHVSMASNAANRLQYMLDNTRTIVAIELLAACQGIDFHKPLTSSARLQTYYNSLRQVVPFYEEDRYFAVDIEQVKKLIIQGTFTLRKTNEA